MSCVLSRVQLFASPWTMAHQASLSMEFQARILVQAAISYSLGSSQLKDQTHVSCVFCIGGRILLALAPPGSPWSLFIF